MLQYLGNNNESEKLHEQLEDGREIDIDVTNYTIKMGRYARGKDEEGKPLSYIYHNINSNNEENSKSTLLKSSKYRKNLVQENSKPSFKKVNQINCFDITEIEELESSFSSTIQENESFSRNYKNDIENNF